MNTHQSEGDLNSRRTRCVFLQGFRCRVGLFLLRDQAQDIACSEAALYACENLNQDRQSTVTQTRTWKSALRPEDIAPKASAESPTANMCE